MKFSPEINAKIIDWKRRIEKTFAESDWRELGIATNCYELVDGHHRLLRSLSFSDDDYAGHVLSVLRDIVRSDLENVKVIDDFLDEKEIPSGEVGVTEATIACRPSVFEPPVGRDQRNLVAVMMPFAAEFKPVYLALKKCCAEAGYECARVDEIWNNSVVIQDVFDLIFESWIVIVDFSGKNPNVMYETGIAHTLGRTVIPITQSIDDVPFDLRHHRVLKYLANAEGLSKLKLDLFKRLATIGHYENARPWVR